MLLALAATSANAQAPQRSAPRQALPTVQTLTSIPANSATITHWYKQNVYDPSDNKIGEIIKGAKGFKCDRTAMTWIAEDSPATTGQPEAPAPRPSNR
jgi:hypothetical protein